ncbi:MAG: Phosphoglucosamine mutase [Planctomycetes bacterium]|nr:Phosphoglucosamine mutase [Planctomycetota bacterium]
MPTVPASISRRFMPAARAAACTAAASATRTVIVSKKAVVGTSMTNGALETLLAAGGMSLVRTAVGDRHIVAEMRARGHGLGGEPSGHVILPVRESGARGAPLLTGDGLRAALAFLRCMKDEGLAASAVPGGYRAWPQEIRSLVTDGRPPLASLARTSAAISAAEASLGASGRVVVRWSGTEPKLRIMVEAGTPAALRAAMDPIVAAVREEAGGR